MSLLQQNDILKNERLLIRLLDRTFQKGCKVETLDYEKELPKNVARAFGSNTFSLQLDKIITELIRLSIIHADKTMKKMSAAKVNESFVLTEDAVRISSELSQEASESIVRMLKDDAIYYEHPRQLARRISDLWGNERYRAERFARTFTADVATATTVARYRQYGVRYMEFDAELDDRTTNQCRCLNGTIFDLTKDSVDRYRPPLHQHCRSGLVPLTGSDYEENREFENRNFDNVLDNPDDVSRAFKNIDTFNEKYRVSKFKLDQDLAARIMFEKGFSVGISGPDLSGLVQGVSGKVEFVPAKTVKEAEEWAANTLNAGKVSYRGLSVDSANEVNRALLDAGVGKKVPAFREIKSMKFKGANENAGATADMFNRLNINTAIMKDLKSFESYEKLADDSRDYVKKQLAAGKLTGKLKEDAERILSFDRTLVGNSRYEVVTHEIGHQIDYQAIMKNKELRSKIQANEQKYVKNISSYADKNSFEYMAESYTAYRRGEAANLDPILVKFFDELM